MIPLPGSASNISRNRSSRPGWAAWGALAWTVAVLGQARADPFFDNYDIAFTRIPASQFYTVTDNDPVKTKLPNGYRVEYNYTLEAKEVIEIDTTWSASRRFDLRRAEELVVRISGSTKATMPANNTLDPFIVSGAIVPGQVVGAVFESGRLVGPLNNRDINWNRSADPMEFAARDNYQLEMFSGPTWTPNAVGDKLSFSSEYTVTVTSVPEPTALALACFGVAGLAAWCRKGRNPTPSRRPAS